MPPEGFTTITVSDDVFEQVTDVMLRYECDSPSDAVSIAATLSLERDEAQIAQILVDLLSE